MATETLTRPQQNVKHTYYVVFNDQGKIFKINGTAPAVITEGMNQIETTNPACAKIIQGKASLKKYGMIWDVIKEKWDIDLRSTTLIIESKHNKLLPFTQDIIPDDAEIFVKAFYNSSKVLVQANKYKIKSSKNLGDITEISTKETNLLDIYITRKNDPDHLISTIEIDPLLLFKEGVQVIDLGTNITKKVDWNNISLYTKQVFNDYGWSLTSTMSTNKDGLNKIVQSSKTKTKTDINIKVVDNTLNITSELNESQLYYFGGKNSLKVVVCDTVVDNFVGAFEIKADALIRNKADTTINFKWPKKPLLIYKNNYLTVSTGDVHEQDAKH